MTTPRCIAPLPLPAVLSTHRDRSALLWEQALATCGSRGTRERAEDARDEAAARWAQAIEVCETDPGAARAHLREAASLARRWGDDGPEQAALLALDDAPLCGAPATTTRTVGTLERVECPLCATHAAEIDADHAAERCPVAHGVS